MGKKLTEEQIRKMVEWMNSPEGLADFERLMENNRPHLEAFDSGIEHIRFGPPEYFEENMDHEIWNPDDPLSKIKFGFAA